MAKWSDFEDRMRKDDWEWRQDSKAKASRVFKSYVKGILERLVSHNLTLGDAIQQIEDSRVEMETKQAAATQKNEEFIKNMREAIDKDN
jgi:hypothetical protein